MPFALSAIWRALPAKTWLIIGLIGVMLFALSYCHMQGRAAEHAKQVEAQLKTERRNSAAKERAAEERAADTRRNADLEKGLNDAVSNLPDARPSDRRIARHCQRLRNDGVDVSGIPACR